MTDVVDLAVLDAPRRIPVHGDLVGRRAAVLGAPVSHSRSPDLHLAAYRALGLADWGYERLDCTAEQLPALVAGADDAFVGFSVTMPSKRAALEFATERTTRAELVGSANTLVRRPSGWRADCTDIDGMRASLKQVGVGESSPSSALLIGGGGTALPTVAALAAAGITDLTVVVRDAARAADVLRLSETLGIAARTADFVASAELAETASAVGVTVSTVPADAVAALAQTLSTTPRLVDVIYNPWPTPLAAAVQRAGGQVVGGLVMLLHQALSQVEQFTGRPAPAAEMTAALGS